MAEPKIHEPKACLHCILMPIVLEFGRQHPEKTPRQCIGEIAVVIGEVAATGAHLAMMSADEAEELMDETSGAVTDHIVATFMEIYSALRASDLKPS